MAVSGQDALERGARAFLEDLYRSVPSIHGRPRVTLTFAQSIDAKIAGRNGKQVIISGRESMVMTHVMRTMHDGIMVGIGTIINDNPQLNARQLSTPPPVERLPRPIVVDARARTPLDCKLIRNMQAGTGREPLILHGASASDSPPSIDALKSAGALVAATDSTSQDGTSEVTLRWPSIYQACFENDIGSVMIEGGARIISSLLRAHRDGEVPIDALVITVGSTMLGPDGLGYEGAELSGFEHHATRVFGQDAVLAFRAKR